MNTGEAHLNTQGATLRIPGREAHRTQDRDSQSPSLRDALGNVHHPPATLLAGHSASAPWKQSEPGLEPIRTWASGPPPLCLSCVTRSNALGSWPPPVTHREGQEDAPPLTESTAQSPGPGKMPGPPPELRPLPGHASQSAVPGLTTPASSGNLSKAHSQACSKPTEPETLGAGPATCFPKPSM